MTGLVGTKREETEHVISRHPIFRVGSFERMARIQMARVALVGQTVKLEGAGGLTAVLGRVAGQKVGTNTLRSGF